MKATVKGIGQLEAYQSVRKPFAPAVRIQRPVKGGGYRRRQGNWSKWNED